MNTVVLEDEDKWTWNRRDRSQDVQIVDSQFKVAMFHPNWSSGTAAVRGTRILNNGRFYWEINVSHRIFGTSMMFGIGTKKARLEADTFTNLIGEDEHGWALSHKGLIWHNGRWFHYTKPFVENQSVIIGILFDGVYGTLTYYKDGTCLGVAFRDLDKTKEPIFPMVSSTAAKTEMTLTRTLRGSISLQDICRAEIVKRICDKDDVKNLLLPSKMKHFIREAIIENKPKSFSGDNFNIILDPLK